MTCAGLDSFEPTAVHDARVSTVQVVRYGGSTPNPEIISQILAKVAVRN